MPTSRTPSPMAVWKPAFAWSELLFKSAEMMMASGQVIGHRVERMGQAGLVPSPRDAKEFTLMGQEKLEAAAESAQAMSMYWWRTNQQAGARLLQQMTAMSTAWWSMMGKGSPWGSMASGSAGLAKGWADTWKSTGQWSDAATGLMNKGLAPIHLRATANARRLGRR